MFELLSNVQAVPVDQNALTMVHRGMNKVRVSVGEHNSEPSEVYIVTGRVDANLETYIIFYMLEPGIHVVYGFDRNPYDQGSHGQVIDEAIVFVEEMGSILEEVPLQSMAPEQREAWFEKEVLYSDPVIEELMEMDELEEIEELVTEPDEEIGSLEPEQVEDPEDGNIVEIDDDEVQQVLDEDENDDITRDQHPEQDPADEEDFEPAVDNDLADVNSAGMGDVVVAEGDFDELLKQAFLKPDVVEKTRKKTEKQDESIDEEELFPQADEEEVHQDGPKAQEDESAEFEDEPETAKDSRLVAEPDPVQDQEADQGRQEEPVADENTADGTDGRVPGTDGADLKVIRYLSKF